MGYRMSKCGACGQQSPLTYRSMIVLRLDDRNVDFRFTYPVAEEPLPLQIYWLRVVSPASRSCQEVIWPDARDITYSVRMAETL